MSYEGFVVKYCKNGHRKTTVNALVDMYDGEEAEPCKICGEKEEVCDSVDETNGCECEYLTEEQRNSGVQCPAHESISYKDIIGYDKVKCKNCNGRGRVLIKTFVPVDCSCGGKDKKCLECFGTGTAIHLYEGLNEGTHMDCLTCQGRGFTFVPRFDLKYLNR
jgi:hypothetical protein